MRLIDADKLKAHYAWWGNDGAEYRERKADFDTIIDLQPTVEAEPIEVRAAYEQKAYNKGYADGKAEPIKHGHNLSADYPSLFECSVCGYVNDDTYCGVPTTFNYCPNCGARMDEVENGGNK